MAKKPFTVPIADTFEYDRQQDKVVPTGRKELLQQGKGEPAGNPIQQWDRETNTYFTVGHWVAATPFAAILTFEGFRKGHMGSGDRFVWLDYKSGITYIMFPEDAAEVLYRGIGKGVLQGTFGFKRRGGASYGIELLP